MLRVFGILLSASLCGCAAQQGREIETLRLELRRVQEEQASDRRRMAAIEARVEEIAHLLTQPKAVAEPSEPLPGTVVIDMARADFDHIVANPEELARSARLVPAIQDGKPSGFKVYGVRSEGPAARVGLENGDQILRLNGAPLNTPEEAMEAYNGLAGRKEVRISLLRRGEPTEILIRVAD